MKKEQVLQFMKEQVDLVISGEKNEVKLPYVYPEDVVSYIKEKYGVEKDNWDTNGWQYDFWFYFKINDIKYCLSGSGYYGRLEFTVEVDY